MGEDTLELFLTPEQIYQLEESARLAVGREPRQRSPQPPRLKVITAPQSKVQALQPVAPMVVMPRAPNEEERPDAPALTKAAQAVPRPRRPAATSIFRRRSLFQLLIALLVPAIAVAAMIQVSAFELPIAPLPASAIARPPSSAAPVAQTLTPTTAVAEPAIAKPPVKFANPFDRSEIFQFPPGTTRQEARDAVAQILIDRASERRHRVRTVRR